MAKIRKAIDGRVAFLCPGCECAHEIYVDGAWHPVWEWNGSVENPTFSPSIRVRWEEGDGKPVPKVCHSYVREGKIQFLNDCTHAFAGQTLEIPEWEDL